MLAKILSTNAVKRWLSSAVMQAGRPLPKTHSDTWKIYITPQVEVALKKVVSSLPLFRISDVTVGGSLTKAMKTSVVIPNDVDVFIWGNFTFKKTATPDKPWEHACPELDIQLKTHYPTLKQVVTTEHWALYSITLDTGIKLDIKFINKNSPGNIGAFTSELQHIRLTDYLASDKIPFIRYGTLTSVTWGAYSSSDLFWLADNNWRDCMAPVRLNAENTCSVKEDKFFRWMLDPTPLLSPFYEKLILLAFFSGFRDNPAALTQKLHHQCESHFPGHNEKSAAFVVRVLQTVVQHKDLILKNFGDVFLTSIFDGLIKTLETYKADLSFSSDVSFPAELVPACSVSDKQIESWRAVSDEETIAKRLKEMQLNKEKRFLTSRLLWMIFQPQIEGRILLDGKPVVFTPSTTVREDILTGVIRLNLFLDQADSVSSMVVVSMLQGLFLASSLQTEFPDKAFLSFASQHAPDPNSGFSKDMVLMLLDAVEKTAAHGYPDEAQPVKDLVTRVRLLLDPVSEKPLLSLPVVLSDSVPTGGVGKSKPASSRHKKAFKAQPPSHPKPVKTMVVKTSPVESSSVNGVERDSSQAVAEVPSLEKRIASLSAGSSVADWDAIFTESRITKPLKSMFLMHCSQDIFDGLSDSSREKIKNWLRSESLSGIKKLNAALTGSFILWIRHVDVEKYTDQVLDQVLATPKRFSAEDMQHLVECFAYLSSLNKPVNWKGRLVPLANFLTTHHKTNPKEVNSVAVRIPFLADELPFKLTCLFLLSGSDDLIQHVPPALRSIAEPNAMSAQSVSEAVSAVIPHFLEAPAQCLAILDRCDSAFVFDALLQKSPKDWGLFVWLTTNKFPWHDDFLHHIQNIQPQDLTIPAFKWINFYGGNSVDFMQDNMPRILLAIDKLSRSKAPDEVVVFAIKLCFHWAERLLKEAPKYFFPSTMLDTIVPKLKLVLLLRQSLYAEGVAVVAGFIDSVLKEDRLFPTFKDVKLKNFEKPLLRCYQTSEVVFQLMDLVLSCSQIDDSNVSRYIFSSHLSVETLSNWMSVVSTRIEAFYDYDNARRLLVNETVRDSYFNTISYLFLILSTLKRLVNDNPGLRYDDLVAIEKGIVAPLTTKVASIVLQSAGNGHYLSLDDFFVFTGFQNILAKNVQPQINAYQFLQYLPVDNDGLHTFHLPEDSILYKRHGATISFS